MAVHVYRTTAKAAATHVRVTHTCLLGIRLHAVAKPGAGDSRTFRIGADREPRLRAACLFAAAWSELEGAIRERYGLGSVDGPKGGA
jgi:hypothetical protein